VFDQPAQMQESFTTSFASSKPPYPPQRGVTFLHACSKFGGLHKTHKGVEGMPPPRCLCSWLHWYC